MTTQRPVPSIPPPHLAKMKPPILPKKTPKIAIIPFIAVHHVTRNPESVPNVL